MCGTGLNASVKSPAIATCGALRQPNEILVFWLWAYYLLHDAVWFCAENVILLCELLLADHSSSSWLDIIGEKDLSFRLLRLFSIVAIASYSRALAGSELGQAQTNQYRPDRLLHPLSFLTDSLDLLCTSLPFSTCMTQYVSSTSMLRSAPVVFKILVFTYLYLVF